MNFRIGSLFSGIGGLDLGLEWGIKDAETVWQVEQADWPREILARHWPDADRSVTDVKKGNKETLAPVDLICGGFPCQDISLAGKQEGFANEKNKSSLWFEMARIISDLRPEYVVLENVSAITSIHKGSVHGRVLGDLVSLGYSGEWHRVGAVDVSLPHRRWRWFFCGYLTDSDGGLLRSAEEPREERQTTTLSSDYGEKGLVADSDRARRTVSEAFPVGVSEKLPQPPRRRQSLADTLRERRPRQGEHVEPRDQETTEDRETTRSLRGRKVCPRTSVEPLGRVVNGFPDKLGSAWNRQALRALGNAVVPQCAELIGRRVQELREGVRR